MRHRLVDSATELILSNGFAATSVDSICEHAGASKGSFYHFFKSKNDIGTAVLEVWFKKVQAMSEGGPFQTEVDPERRLLGFINHTRNLSPGLWGRGSVLASVAMELGRNATIQEACSRLLAETHARTSDLFQPASASLDRNPTASELSRLFLAVIEGAALLARAEGRPEVAQEVFNTFQLCLKRLVEYSRESA